MRTVLGPIVPEAFSADVLPFDSSRVLMTIRFLAFSWGDEVVVVACGFIIITQLFGSGFEFELFACLRLRGPHALTI